jgi:SAM-dependent methyltransferase
MGRPRLRSVHQNSRLLFERYALEYFSPTLTVLEIGPDGFPSTYARLASERGESWDTLDLDDRPELTYRSSPEYAFPIDDEQYDIVLSGQVIEHVPRIWRWMPELARVCKTGGLVITINPVSWPYHEAPRDCWRGFPDGMTALYEDSSLDVLLSRWESLEAPGYRRHVPGRSLTHQPRVERTLSQILGRFGWPVERAYDTITIGRKLRADA